MKYNQVLLRKVNTEQRVYIPSSFANIGEILKIKRNGEWDNGWIVKEKSTEDIDEEHLPDSHAEIKAHRNKTGDSAPKDKSKRGG